MDNLEKLVCFSKGLTSLKGGNVVSKWKSFECQPLFWTRMKAFLWPVHFATGEHNKGLRGIGLLTTLIMPCGNSITVFVYFLSHSLGGGTRREGSSLKRWSFDRLRLWEFEQFYCSWKNKGKVTFRTGRITNWRVLKSQWKFVCFKSSLRTK